MLDKSKSSYHHGDLRNALIEAALVLIREKGPNAVSLREVAKKAGVSHGAPYRHFADKKALLVAITILGFQKLVHALEDAIRSHPGNPEKQLKQACFSYTKIAMENPEITRLMFGGYIEPQDYTEELTEVSDRSFETYIRIIETGKDAGILAQRDSKELAMATWAMIHGYSILLINKQLHQHIHGDEQALNINRMLSRLLLEGIGQKS